MQPTQPDPDPGNSEPDQWTRDLDPDAEDVAYAKVNEIVVQLPEPKEGVQA